MNEEVASPNLTSIRPSVSVSGRRFFAVVIDMIIASLVMGVIDATFGVVQVVSGTVPPPASAGTNHFPIYTYSAVPLVQWAGGHMLWSILVMAITFLLQESVFGGITLGKSIIGLRVVDLNGKRLSLKAALIRNVFRLIDILPGALFSLTIGPLSIQIVYVVGAIAMWTSSSRQRLGDRLAHTLVVKAETVPQAHLPFSQLLLRLGCVTVVLISLLAFCAHFDYYDRPPLVIAGWRNTNEWFFSSGVKTYSLGPAIRGDETVSYPIQYITATDLHCSGTVTLRWRGWIAGWNGDHSQASCYK